MERNSKQHLCIGLFLFVTVTCLLLCHFSLGAVAGSQQVRNQSELSAGENTQEMMEADTVLAAVQTTITDTQSGSLILPSVLNVRAALDMKSRDNQFRKLMNHIFAVLFKTVFIPTFIFAIMGRSLWVQTPLQKSILQYIQAKDGKKQVA